MDRIDADRTAWVYILTNRPRGVLYVGATANLPLRIWHHKLGVGSAFAAKHGLRLLVHAEPYTDILLAREREWSLKRWRRAWKFELIEAGNPDWCDLYGLMQL